MDDYMKNTIPDKIKKHLNEQLESHSTFLEFANAKIYISYEYSDSFEFTHIEGCLCLVINRKDGCLYLQNYEYNNLTKDFEIELYTNIKNGYSVLNDLFHSIEFPKFFLGISFANKINAEKMKNTILFNSIILDSKPSHFNLASPKFPEL
jgi:hypothetical protein